MLNLTGLHAAFAILLMAGPAIAAPAKGGAAHPAPTPKAASGSLDFGKQVMPLFEKYCVGCHGGEKKKADLDLGAYKGRDEAGLLKDMHLWQDISERLESRDMPPEENPQPSDAEVELLMTWLDRTISKAAATSKRDPGRVTIRRLNRAEYNNTVRDLLGLDLRPAQDFPSDDVGYGFDNIGDVLSLPPVLLERYLTAAERIAERAIVGEVPPRRRQQTVQIEKLAPTPAGSRVRGGALLMGASASVRTRLTFPVGGEYILRLKAGGKFAAGESPRVILRIDGRDAESFEIGPTKNYVAKTRIEAGPRRIELAFVNAEAAPARPGGPARVRELTLDQFVVDGPVLTGGFTLPPSHARLIPRPPGKETWRQDAREFLAPLIERAYRRPVKPHELERVARFVDQAVEGGETFERGMQMALRAVLVSPHFLYRVELDEGAGGPGGNETRPLNDWELASRLAYFLWTSMPDDELFSVARAGKLRDPATLQAQVKRMLADKKASALVENFATQWLQIRNLAGHRANRRQFPGFDEDLKTAMLRESELFFEAVMREDLSILTFIDADFTFLNERLAKHYNIDGVEGTGFRKVSLTDGLRGGVVTQASVLTVTSNPTRTSPVKRGRWVLEQLLGTPPPPPPPGVPELKEKDKHEKPASLRARLEQHRADPNCAVCHKKMDPLGFGLENFDAVGSWRTHDEDLPIDSTGVLPGGQSFSGPAQLKAVLKSKEHQFRRSLVSKMMTYALGRGTEPYDRPAIDDVGEQMVRAGNTFSSMILGIVRSDPFSKRRVKEPNP